jgi:sporadic carbohydrate cluster protein (TIGR04323 family)
MKSLRGYIHSRKFMGERCPQHVQNLVLRDYCQKYNYKYMLSGAEYAMEGSYIILNQVISEIPNIDGVVFYSLFQLPKKQKERKEIYRKILQKSGEIHFALEGLKITRECEVTKIENIWMIHLKML